MEPTLFRFTPRPITIERCEGWDVVVQDEVTGELVTLAPSAEPTRAPRSPGEVRRKDLFVPFGGRLERPPIIDGHRIEEVDGRFTLTELATGARTTLLHEATANRFQSAQNFAIRAGLALIVQDGGRTVHAFAIATGELVWKTTLASFAGVGFLGDAPVVCTHDGELVMLDPLSSTSTVSHRLTTRGTPTVHSGETGVFVHHDRGVVFVDGAGPHVVVDELADEPRFAARGDSWCRIDPGHARIIAGRGHGPARSLELDAPAVSIWVDPRGLAWSTRDAIVFVPFETLARDGELHAACRDVVDERPPSWTTATVTVASRSFLIVRDAFGRRTYGWKDAGFVKDATFEVAGFVRGYAGKEHGDQIAHPTLARRGGQVLALVGGSPFAPLPASVRLGVTRGFVAHAPAPSPVVELLLARGLIERTPSVDRAIAAGISNAALVLQWAHGARDGIAIGFVAYDHKVFNDTDDPIADLVAIGADPRVRARMLRVQNDCLELELEGKRQALEIDEKLIAKLGARFNRALAAVDARRRIHELRHDEDFYALLACDPETRDALEAGGIELDEL